MKFASSLRVLSLLAAGAITSVAFANNQISNLPQELWPGPPAASASTLSRAEVRADLQVWQRAGMDKFSQGDGVSWNTADYERRLRHYQEMRQSPAFAELVKKLQDQR